MRAVDELVPFARNARTHSDAQVAQVAALIREFGWTSPVLIDEQSGIIAGHARVLAARKLGLAFVPSIVLNGLSDAQRRAYIIADNKVPLNADWDYALLTPELQELASEGEIDLTLTGFTKQELEKIAAWDPDAEPPQTGTTAHYQILIECDSESAQAQMLQRLMDQGIECRALIR
jgi:ParB-like chromosome segregation protein Spo0J